ncbi:hypothetical protein ACFOWM_01290 [Ferruginibacter yonginensis]|uniref:Uncharacterized protein n=1 Tax=Ferruginibacter yonginensis TaxID=1310416 RepID=A0ABV8QNW5_9BACT
MIFLLQSIGATAVVFEGVSVTESALSWFSAMGKGCGVFCSNKGFLFSVAIFYTNLSF